LFNALANIFKIPELRKRILFTLALLAIYRVGVFVTTPGVNRRVMADVVAQPQSFLGLFNLFSGGALENFSVFALGIMPYVTSSIILQLLAVVVPKLNELRQDSQTQAHHPIHPLWDGGALRHSRYGHGAVSREPEPKMPFPVCSGRGLGLPSHDGAFHDHRNCLHHVAGRANSERGIGNSLIIMAGIVSSFPSGLGSTLDRLGRGDLGVFPGVVLAILAVLVVGFICFVERAQRRIPVQYTRRAEGRTSFAGKTSYLPLKVNSSGVIPPIFASSLLIFPSTVAGFFPESELAMSIQAALNPLDWRYNLYVLLIIFFCFFYTAVTFDPIDVADNMKRRGGFIPGIRAGKKTAEYIDYVLTRITAGGAIYIAAVCVLPILMQVFFNVPFSYGGTSLLIVVSVGLDTVAQIEQHLITRHYEGITGPRGPRIRGRRAMAA
jgi:preprotein translocase subunit SecY